MSFADFGKRPGWAAQERRKAAEDRRAIQREADRYGVRLHRETMENRARVNERTFEAWQRVMFRRSF